MLNVESGMVSPFSKPRTNPEVERAQWNQGSLGYIVPYRLIWATYSKTVSKNKSEQIFTNGWFSGFKER